LQITAGLVMRVAYMAKWASEHQAFPPHPHARTLFFSCAPSRTQSGQWRRRRRRRGPIIAFLLPDSHRFERHDTPYPCIYISHTARTHYRVHRHPLDLQVGDTWLVRQALSPIIGRPFSDFGNVARLTGLRYLEAAFSGTFSRTVARQERD
jgi:hypothetical protein